MTEKRKKVVVFDNGGNSYVRMVSEYVELKDYIEIVRDAGGVRFESNDSFIYIPWHNIARIDLDKE